MITPVETPEVRISVRVDRSLLSGVQKIADERFEGRLSMAAREAFRKLVDEERSEKERELAVAS